jgi:hypothetical protein
MQYPVAIDVWDVSPEVSHVGNNRPDLIEQASSL